jgi:hypothetical protein
MVVVGAALLFAAAWGGQTQSRAPQASSGVPANAWMKAPYELSIHDDLASDLRHARNEHWDGMLGYFGVLTPQSVVHTSHGDYGPPAGEEPEIPKLRENDAALIGTFESYRTVLTPSGRVIYTDMTFRVEHTFQDAVRGHAASGSEITVSVPGGTVRTADGRVISFMTDPTAYFMQPGRTYLLFLYYFADGEFYFGSGGFDLSDGVVRANSSIVKAKAARNGSTLLGLTKEELIRLLDERIGGKR